MTRDLCRLMKKVEAHPYDKVDWTVREFLLMRTHVKVCLDCKKIARDIDATHPPKPFGLDNRQEN